MTVPVHLQGAAEALCAIARQRCPDQAWVARFEDGERVDAHRYAAGLSRDGVVAAGADELHAVGDRHTTAAPDASRSARGCVSCIGAGSGL